MENMHTDVRESKELIALNLVLSIFDNLLLFLFHLQVILTGSVGLASSLMPRNFCRVLKNIHILKMLGRCSLDVPSIIN